MGKAAENERLKFQAALLNNLGAVFIMSGLILPSLKIYGNQALRTNVLAGNFTPLFTTANIVNVAVGIFCLCCGIFLHRWGIRYLKRLQD
jgi:hypothetical protein